VKPALPLWVIGSDGGFLPAPVQLQTAGLQIQPSERYDIIVDFTGITPGTRLYLINEGPAATVGTTGSMMQFQVVAPTSIDLSIPPAILTLPGFKTNNATVAATRQVSFNEQASTFNSQVTVHYLCGTVNADGTANPLFWSDPISEKPVAGTTEVWEVYNYTPVTHVFHVHLVEFQVQNRQALAITNGAAAPSGDTIAPAVYEVGDKDSVSAPGGQVTRIKATFDRQGLYTWHCHLLDHEDNEMMRPWQSVTS
jgi:spore coat protein A